MTVYFSSRWYDQLNRGSGYLCLMLTVSELYIYPIKSLGGIKVSAAQLTDRGFQYDRRWMLVDVNNQFLTQREFPQMALLQVHITSDGLEVQHKISGDNINIPFIPETTKSTMVRVWDDDCEALFVNEDADAWFSRNLSTPCRLVYMPENSHRLVEATYRINDEITSLSDGYPLLMIGQASLDDLNQRLQELLPINRFRPNIVFTGGEAFEEDSMEEFMINGIALYGVKLCARCTITTIDQDNSQKGKEPLRTLATYRQENNKIYFGQNLLYNSEGRISVGDAITVKKKRPIRNFTAVD